jgi:stage V sporulation protein SpoVS
VAKNVRTAKARPQRASAGAIRDMARSELIARKLAKVAPDDDPAHVAGAIAIFATETIKRSANSLGEARAYLDGLRAGIDGLLKNAFPENVQKEPRG